MNAGNRPVLSLVVPAYNEEEVLGFTVSQLLRAFESLSMPLELVVVDNGSKDRTGEIIESFAKEDSRVKPVRVEKNRGIGWGIQNGFRACTGAWVGYIPADGQVDAQDVAHLYEAASSTNGRVVAKVRRHFRVDGFKRKVVSISYNGFFRALWPTVRSLDINGCPKLLPKPAIDHMYIESNEWMMDPEIMVKSLVLNLKIMEFNVFGRMRGGGVSQVRSSTLKEFTQTLIESKFTGRWVRQVDQPGFEAAMVEWSKKYAFSGR